MPNHISNRLTITADSALTAEIFAAIRGESPDSKAWLIDFDRIIPMPAALKNTGCGGAVIDGVSVRKWWTDNSDNPNRSPDRLLTDEEKAAIDATGFDNWYEWSRKNWGTKWNAYEIKREGENAIYFETAWSPPVPVLVALAKKYPQAKFTLEYADESIGSHTGIIVYEGGELHSDTEFGYKPAAKLWFELNQRDPASRGYDPVTFERFADV